MLQNYYDTNCIECHEAIYNPLCPLCIAREVSSWLENKPQRIKKIVAQEVRGILGSGKLLDESYSECIACKNRTAFLCPYCFTELIYKKLKKEKVSKEILREFLTFFNFDFEHTGYSKDMEKLGML